MISTHYLFYRQYKYYQVSLELPTLQKVYRPFHPQLAVIVTVDDKLHQDNPLQSRLTVLYSSSMILI